VNARPVEAERTPPKAVAGFSHIRRFWDPRHQAWAAKLLPGDFYVTPHDEVLLTVLGSCVSVCIRDPASGIGGMNHFMLPRPPAHEKDQWRGLSGVATRYGTASMEQLIGNLIKLGADRSRLEVKLFGGGRVLAGMTDVGRQNIEFAREFMHAEKLIVAAEDLGGIWPRQVQYFPRTGRARVRRLERPDVELAQREVSYLDSLEKQPKPGELDLF
jgi:chemotaxis protein CheD